MKKSVQSGLKLAEKKRKKFTESEGEEVKKNMSGV